ncbi:MAG: hypothetical protein IJZ88_07280 [Clostridia bacterium]|nr:hypothetical protein [Clostridia bacterium]
MKKVIKDNYHLLIFSISITAFVLVFTRYFMKMDDGNFLGIATAPDFSYENFLSYRYNNISGRTVNEFLVMFFCRHNIIWWKIFVSSLLIFIACFFSKLSSFFAGEFLKVQRQIFASLTFFMMMVSCLNPAVFWFAGSFTYLFPFAGLCAVSLPFLKYIYEKQISLPLSIVGVLGCAAACSQEQGAVCCIALILIFFVFIKVKKLSFKPLFLLDLIVSVGLTVHLFTSPGMAKRGEMESAGFERFNEMNVLQKLFCGISVFFANSFYLSFVLIIVLVALLSLAVYHVSKNKKSIKLLLISANCLSVFICVVLNIVCCVSGKGLAHMQMRSAFKSGEFTPEVIMMITFGFLLLAVIVSLCFLLAVKKSEAGIPVLLCLAAGFGCAMMMSFSSSIFSSGQRVFFFTNMFVGAACLILLSTLPETKLSKMVYNLAIFYALATAGVNVFAFTFIEHPLMG